MNHLLSARISDFRRRHRKQRRAIGTGLIVVGLAAVSSALWSYTALHGLPPPDPGSETAQVIFLSTEVASSRLMTFSGAALVASGFFLLLARDRRTEFTLEMLELALAPERQHQGDPSPSMASQVVWLIFAAVLGGASLTTCTAAIYVFGGDIGRTAATVLGFPAILWSNMAYTLDLYPCVNGLLADPGGLFCFASYSRRLSSHYQSAFPAFTVFSVAMLGVRLAVLSARNRKRQVSESSQCH